MKRKGNMVRPGGTMVGVTSGFMESIGIFTPFTLTADRNRLNQRYVALKDEVKEAEQIRKSVYSILRQEQREQQPKRAHDIDR